MNRRYWLAVPAPPEAEPMDLLRLGARQDRGRFYYASREGWEVCGMGEAEVLIASGAERFAVLADRVEAEVARLGFVGDAGMDHRWLPQFVGGFSFDDEWEAVDGTPWQGFAPGRLVLPEVTFVSRNSDKRLVGVAPNGMSEASAREFLLRTLRRTSDLLHHVEDQRSERLSPLPAYGGGGGDGLAARSPVASVQAAVRRGGELAARGELPVDLTEEPLEAYLDRVERALETIEHGSLSKVIVARAEDWRPPRPVDAADLLQELARCYPRCFRFCVQPAGGPAFVGASPERLVKVEDHVVHADAMAGTARRSRDAEQDAALAADLFGDEKERREHLAVVDYLHRTLGPVVPALEAASEPAILRLANVQHLHTPFRGELSELEAGAGVLQLAARVHPTPAVAGVPQRAAMAWQREHEGLDRGWYAGGVGTVAPRGEGEFCVAIRSGLLQEGRARLFAGAGVVRGSQPELEQAEVDAKLRGLREVLFHA